MQKAQFHLVINKFKITIT